MGKSAVERVLSRYAAIPQLERLVDAGCNRIQLLLALELAFLGDESWKTLLGMNLRAFKGAIRHINHCADLIDRLIRSRLIYRLSIEHGDPRFVRIHQSPTLGDQVRRFAYLIDQQRSLFGRTPRIRHHLWKAWIVAIVIEHTKKPHDSEVAALIAAVLKSSKYTEKAHQAWRLKHRDFVEMMKSEFREQIRNFGPSNSH